MQKIVINSLSVFFSLFIALSLLSCGASSAQRKPSTNSSCAHLIMRLDGKKSATSRCVDTAKSTKKSANTLHITQCDNNSLHLYWNMNEDNTQGEICFVGAGFFNLTDYWGPWYSLVSWNDQASSYSTGCTMLLFQKQQFSLNTTIVLNKGQKPRQANNR